MNKKMKGVIFIVCLIMFISTISNGMQIGSSKNKKYDGCNCKQENDIYIQHQLGHYLFIGRFLEKLFLEPINSQHLASRVVNKDIPKYFSWKDYNGQDWTTPAKDQKSCGACAAFGPVGAIESIINIREDCAVLNLDLSEQYVLSCLPYAASIPGYGCALGGGVLATFRYLEETTAEGNYHNGIIPESCFPYIGMDAKGCSTFLDCDNEPVLCSGVCENWDELLVPILDWGYWHPNGSDEDREAIKSYIIEKGPVTTDIWVTIVNSTVLGRWDLSEWGEIHHDHNDYFPYTRPPLLCHYKNFINSAFCTNHVVLIVGWKDDPSIQNGGYWICKNSWGSDWGYDGFFNIEYGSLNIDSSTIAWVDYDPSSVDWPPVADAGGVYQGYIGEEIQFDGSDSVDAEGNITSYYWDFGDETTGTGISPSHTYIDEGIYHIKLSVTDVRNNTGCVYSTVEIK